MTAVNVTAVSVIAGLTRNLCREKEAFWTPSLQTVTCYKTKTTEEVHDVE
jgi:hypothetical protein